MDWTVVITVLGGGQWRWFGFRCVRWRVERAFRDRVFQDVIYRLDRFGAEFRSQRALHRLTGSTFGALPALRRNTCPFEFMVRVAGGAACLLDLIFDHGHDGVVGDAAFARAVIVQNVTEPKPALLH